MKYSENGFWIKKENDQYTIGLSEKGQDDFGEVTFVSLEADETLTTDSTILSIEAEKAVSSLTSPLKGNVVKVHQELEDAPELLNSEDQNENWIIVLTDVDEASYEALQNESGLTE